MLHLSQAKLFLSMAILLLEPILFEVKVVFLLFCAISYFLLSVQIWLYPYYIRPVFYHIWRRLARTFRMSEYGYIIQAL